MRFTVVATSLSPYSRSRQLAHLAAQQLTAKGHQVTALDLRQTPLPLFDDEQTYTHPNVATYHQAIAQADGVLLAVPIYNWNTGSGVKNLLELTGSHAPERGLQAAWFDKVVSFLVSGGLHHGYTSHLALAGGLLVDFKCIINPYHVYAVSADWENGQLLAPLQARFDKTLAVHVDLCRVLAQRHYTSTWEM